MPSFKKVIFSLICFVAHIVLLAQTDRFTRYTTKDGLSSDEVYNLHQDKNGYIWIFTNYGALKYNSVEFKPVLKNLPFRESFIYSIYENEKGQKWVANSNANIYEIINDSAFLVRGAEVISKKLRKNIGEIYQLYVDDSLNIYAITKQISYKLIRQKDNFYKPVNLTELIKYDSIVYKVTDVGKTLLPVFNFQGKETGTLFGRDGRVGILMETKNASKYYEIDRNSGGAPRFFKQKDNKIYFTYYDRFGIISEQKGISYLKLKSVILNFKFDKQGHTWLACLNNGVYELDENDSIIHHYLEDITVNDILIDSQNGLWASSPGMGLFHYKNINNVRFKEDDPLSGSIAFLKEIDHELFVANSKGDVFKIKKNVISPVYIHNATLEPFYKSEKAIDIVKMDSKYWISFTYSLKYVNHPFSKNNKVESVKMPNVIKFIFYENDTIVHLQRRGLGLITKNVSVNRIDLGFKTYDCVFREGVFVIATDNGVYVYPRKFPAPPPVYKDVLPIMNDTLKQPEFLVPTKNSIVKKIVKDPYDNFWFCSIGNGLFVLDKSNRLQHISLAEGLPSIIINNICFSANDITLLCTNKGVYISESHFNETKVFKWKRIYTGEASHSVLFEDKIYVATNSGLVVLDLASVSKAEHIDFNLNAVLINSSEVNKNNLSQLAYNQNNMEFRFDVIQFTDDKCGIRYNLTGPIVDSGFVIGNSFKIQNLPPGEYLLQTFPDITTGRNFKILLPFTILPAFWQTSTFFFLFILFIVAMISLAGWAIFKYQKKKRDKKEAAERLILEYKLVALKAQINPHFMSNCLSAIQLLIINNKVDLATNYIAKFGLLVRQILNFSTRSLISLAEELEVAVLNMDLEQLRFENKFKYEIIIAEGLDSTAVFVPALILNPIIENAVWHGLLPLQNKRQGKLTIEVKVTENMLMLIIDDNGVGRQKKSKNLSNSRQSKGIQLTEQRLSNINYLYNIDAAKIIYTDLLADQDPMGTSVTISLPLNLKPLQYE